MCTVPVGRRAGASRRPGLAQDDRRAGFGRTVREPRSYGPRARASARAERRFALHRPRAAARVLKLEACTSRPAETCPSPFRSPSLRRTTIPVPRPARRARAAACPSWPTTSSSYSSARRRRHVDLGDDVVGEKQPPVEGRVDPRLRAACLQTPRSSSPATRRENSR